MDELWQIIPKWPEYAISNFGIVKRIDDYLYHDDEGNEVYKEVNLYTAPSNKLLVHVYGANGHYNLDIARLVCTLFNSEPLPKQRVLFKDKNKSNCRADNLYWGTYQEYLNMFNTKVGRPKGFKKKRMGLCQATEIRNMYKEGSTQMEIAKRFNISQSTISLILNNKLWNFRNL